MFDKNAYKEEKEIKDSKAYIYNPLNPKTHSLSLSQKYLLISSKGPFSTLERGNLETERHIEERQ